jgi:hypothetical protein
MQLLPYPLIDVDSTFDVIAADAWRRGISYAAQDTAHFVAAPAEDRPRRHQRSVGALAAKIVGLLVPRLHPACPTADNLLGADPDHCKPGESQSPAAPNSQRC